MNFINFIKSAFAVSGQNPAKSMQKNADEPTQTPAFDIEAYKLQQKEYAIKHFVEISKNAQVLAKKYGTDFYGAFYKNNTSEFLRDHILTSIDTNGGCNEFLNRDHWAQKHPLNFPGPFYTGESDTCGTGDIEAPDNVMYDEYCCEYLFRQPKNFAELLCVIDAANVEVFDSYSCNGNSHWTYQKCKDWWKNKNQILKTLQHPEIQKMNGPRINMYINYLLGDAERDLRRYCYFLENGIYPLSNLENLPFL